MIVNCGCLRSLNNLPLEHHCVHFYFCFLFLLYWFAYCIVYKINMVLYNSIWNNIYHNYFSLRLMHVHKLEFIIGICDHSTVWWWHPPDYVIATLNSPGTRLTYYTLSGWTDCQTHTIYQYQMPSLSQQNLIISVYARAVEMIPWSITTNVTLHRPGVKPGPFTVQRSTDWANRAMLLHATYKAECWRINH